MSSPYTTPARSMVCCSSRCAMCAGAIWGISSDNAELSSQGKPFMCSRKCPRVFPPRTGWGSFTGTSSPQMYCLHSKVPTSMLSICTDFGLTKYVESSSQITKSGFFLGTYRYASPEQFKGVHVDHRSDIYSLGCMAFECLTGRAPFVRDTDAAMMHAHLIEAVPAASSMVSNLPSAVDAVIERSMSKNADERYDSCGALVTELRSALVSPSGETSRPLVAPAVVETTEPADVSALETDAPPRASSAPTNPAIETGARSWTTTAHSPRGRDRQGNEGDPLPPTSPATSRGTKTKAETRRRLLAAALIIAMAGGVFLFTRSQRTPASPSDAGFGGNRHAEGGAEETGFGGNRPAETETEETGAGPGTIAFNSVSDGNLDVFTISPSGENLTRLTDNEGRDGGASWSPDGERIVYTSEQSSGEFEIFVMNKDGSGATNLTSNTTTELHPAWSPDGRRIAFSSDRTGRTEIFTMRPDGTNVRQVTDNGSADFEPSWSADSSRLSFVRKREGNFDVVIVSATGAEETVIAEGDLGEANQEDAMLSPTDNDLIAFASDAGGDYEIVVLHLATGKADVLTSNGVNDRDPAWSPDGETLVFSRDEGEGFDLFSMDADGMNIVQLTNNDFEDSRAAISP